MAKTNKRARWSFFSLTLVVVWLASVASAMAVVHATYRARQATGELEALRREASGLRVVSGQYLLERSSWAAYSRVEELASSTLNMRVPEADKTVLVYRK